MYFNTYKLSLEPFDFSFFLFHTGSRQILDDKNLEMLSIHLGTKWKDLARTMKFSTGEIDSLNHDHHIYGLKEIVYQFLKQWRERNGEEATLCAMADALIKLKLYEIAEQLKSN